VFGVIHMGSSRFGRSAVECARTCRYSAEQQPLVQPRRLSYEAGRLGIRRRRSCVRLSCIGEAGGPQTVDWEWNPCLMHVCAGDPCRGPGVRRPAGTGRSRLGRGRCSRRGHRSSLRVLDCRSPRLLRHRVPSPGTVDGAPLSIRGSISMPSSSSRASLAARFAGAPGNLSNSTWHTVRGKRGRQVSRPWCSPFHRHPAPAMAASAQPDDFGSAGRFRHRPPRMARVSCSRVSRMRIA
jgi:hypothetical protein